MKPKDYSKTYADGFDGFREALIDSIHKDDIDVMHLLAPIAEQLYRKQFPQMAGQTEIEARQSGQPQLPKQKFTLKALLEKIQPILEQILPSTKKQETVIESSPIESSDNETIVIAETQLQKNMTFDESIETAKKVASNISDQVLLKIEELERDEKIYSGRSTEEYYIECNKKTIAECDEEIERTKQELEQAKANGADEWQIKSFESTIQWRMDWKQEQEQEIVELKEKIARGEVRQETTTYRPHTDEINVVQEYTSEDAISVIHEAGHAVTRPYLKADNENDTMLNELPSITAELLADKQLAQMGLGGEHRAVERILDMQKSDSRTIVLLNQLFMEIQQTGTVTHTTVDKVLYESFQYPDGYDYDKRKKPEEYTADDVSHFRTMLKGIRYFTGTAGALALRETVKTKEDLDKVFATLNDPNLTDAQRLQQIGVTQENAISSLNDFVQKNREQTVEKMDVPWQEI
ncbi:MAG: hypothetical protein FWE16_02605 [Firmicutes bacterium]|nr:hypothetical protein [Bacillota bacterium]